MWHPLLTLGTKLVSTPAPKVSIIASNSLPMSVAISYTSTGFSGREVAMLAGGDPGTAPEQNGAQEWRRSGDSRGELPEVTGLQKHG